MTVARTTRLALGWLALSALQLGFWALLAPQSFFDNFPGFGRSWIAVDGPYNEHFVRDFGALNLALAVLLVAAAVRLSRDLVSVAAIASLVWGVPHVIYHLANTEDLGAMDNVASVGGLAFGVLLAVMLLISAKKLDDPTL